MNLSVFLVSISFNVIRVVDLDEYFSYLLSKLSK